jgi:hypothetical protein
MNKEQFPFVSFVPSFVSFVVKFLLEVQFFPYKIAVPLG